MTTDTSVTLNKRHFEVAVDRASKLGTTPRAYIESLIDAASESFDAILAPVREGFSKGGTSAEELDELVSKARKAIHAKRGRKAR